MNPRDDREAITLILTALTDVGCTVTAVQDDTWDGDSTTEVHDIGTAVDLVCGVDEAFVYLNLPPDADRHKSHIYFVLGNEPFEVAADYGVSLSPYIEPITDAWDM